MRERGAHLPLVGVAQHQRVIESAVGGRSRAGPNTRLVTVRLERVSNGPYAGAVRAYLGGREIGDVPVEAAEALHGVLAEIQRAGASATCRAVVYGGHYDVDERAWRLLGVGVIAALSPAAVASAVDPFLPPVLGVKVVCDPDAAARLDASLGQRAKTKRVVRLAELQHVGGDWTVSSDGASVGVLARGMGDGQSRLLAAAEAGGWPLTCQMRVLRQTAGPLRVAADLPA